MDASGDDDAIQGCLCSCNVRLASDLPIYRRDNPPEFRSFWFVILINLFSLLPSPMQIPCYDGTGGSAGGNSPAHP